MAYMQEVPMKPTPNEAILGSGFGRNPAVTDNKGDAKSLDSYYSSYPKQDTKTLVKISAVENSGAKAALIARAYAVGLDESHTEYDIAVREWYRNIPTQGGAWYVDSSLSSLRDGNAELRQERINRARAVGLPDETTEVEILVAERSKASKAAKAQEAARIERARRVGLPESASDGDITLATIKANHKGGVWVTPEQLEAEAKRIETEEAKKISHTSKDAHVSEGKSIDSMRESDKKHDLLKRAKKAGLDGSATEAEVVAEEK